MISTQKAVLKLIFLGAFGGWLGGACVNASGDLLKGLVHANALKGLLAGSLTHIVLALPWIFSINSFEKLSVHFKKPILKWGSEILGGGFGVIASILTVYLFFLLWPYEAHGRSGAYKTVIAIVGSSPLAIFGIGGLVGIYASSWIRPKQEKSNILIDIVRKSRRVFIFTRYTKQEQSNTLIDIVLPVIILGGLIGIVGENTKGMNVEEVVVTPESRKCCSAAYQEFVKKLSIHQAIYEAEKYCGDLLCPMITECNILCPMITECIDICEDRKKDCSNEKGCKDKHRECIQSCPDILPNED